jgi:hypothetical protein
VGLGETAIASAAQVEGKSGLRNGALNAGTNLIAGLEIVGGLAKASGLEGEMEVSGEDREMTSGCGYTEDERDKERSRWEKSQS